MNDMAIFPWGVNAAQVYFLISVGYFSLLIERNIEKYLAPIAMEFFLCMGL
jgi:hypothetical protein